MNEVTFKNARVWVNTHQRQDGTSWESYAVAINKKRQDGTFAGASLPLRFSKDINVPRNMQSGTRCDLEGWLSVDEYTTKDGEEVKRVCVFATSASFGRDIEVPHKKQEAYEDPIDNFIAAEEDIPF